MPGAARVVVRGVPAVVPVVLMAATLGAATDSRADAERRPAQNPCLPASA